MSTPGRQHQTHGLLSCEFLTCSASHRSWNQRQRGHDSHQNTERAWITPKHREGMTHTKTQRGHESHQNTERARLTPKHREGMTHTKTQRGHESHQNTERAWITLKQRGHESQQNTVFQKDASVTFLVRLTFSEFMYIWEVLSISVCIYTTIPISNKRSQQGLLTTLWLTDWLSQ